MGHRPARVAEMIHRELSVRLRTEIKDPRMEPISIIHVEVSGDLGRAVISFLPLGGGAVSEDLTEALKEAARRLRGPIGRALRLRRAPDLHFQCDSNTETAFRVDALLAQARRERVARTGEEE